MQKLILSFIKFPIWSTSFKLLVFGLGILAVFKMQTSFFPEVPSRNINVSIIYPGASPEEIETSVIQKIEDNLKGIQGIERFQSNSQENSGSLTIETLQEFDVNDVFIDVKNAVDRINSFPASMEPAVVSVRPVSEFVYSFALTSANSKVDLISLKNAAKKIEDDLRDIGGISQIKYIGFPSEEIVINLNEDKLKEYNLTFDIVSNSLKLNNLDITAGTIKTSNEDLLIRLENKKYYADELLDYIVRTNVDGSIVRLKDISKIENAWSESPLRTYLNGKPAVIITINKLLGEDILKISEKIEKYITTFNSQNKVIKAEVLEDGAISLKQRIQLLINNGVSGIILVVICLTLFLNWRISFWVALAIPFSFSGMFLFAYLFDYTINVISLLGCIIAVGIVVDDGIVIAEQVYQEYEKGAPAYIAASVGTSHVSISILFSILTTIMAFLPFFFIDTPGPRIADMAFVVIFALIFSLLEANFILPSHLAHSKALSGKLKESKIRKKFNKVFNYLRDDIYAKILDFTIEHKSFPFAIAIAFVIISFGAIEGGIIKFTFFPIIDANTFNINIELPSGTRETKTLEILNRIEKAAWDVSGELTKDREDKKQVIEKITKNIATSTQGRALLNAVGDQSGNSGNLQIILMDENIRKLNSQVIAEKIREKVGDLYEVEKSEFGSSSFFGKPISISLVSRNLNELRKAKEELKFAMSSIPDLRDVGDNDPQGTKEININLKSKAYILGFTSAEITKQIRQGFFGDEIQRLQRNGDEIRVWVRYNLENRNNISNFENMRIKSLSGQEIPLLDLITYKIERGSIKINHIDGKREITVDAQTKDPRAEIPKINSKIKEEILAPILKKYSSVSTVVSGQQRLISKLQQGIVLLPIAYIIIYILIALSLNSFLQALLVVLLIPFGVLGAIWGHWMQGMMVNIMSFYGVVALSGIIVNDSIVFLSQFNSNIKSQMPFTDSIKEAAISRFRPIILTTITTAAGLYPLVLETSPQAQFLIPIAISLSAGLVFATGFILLMLPSLVILANDFKRLIFKIKNGYMPTREEVEPILIIEKNSKFNT